LDDCSCNIVFEDMYTAKRVLSQLGRPIPAGVMTPGMAADMGWVEAYLLTRHKDKVPVLLRVALVTDVKSEVEEHRQIKRGGKRRPVLGPMVEMQDEDEEESVPVSSNKRTRRDDDKPAKKQEATTSEDEDRIRKAEEEEADNLLLLGEALISGTAESEPLVVDEGALRSRRFEEDD
jgi:hypothetical protein